MNDSIKLLKGSAYRDAVKYWHKQLPNSTWLYACDNDLVFISGKLGPIAVIDVKKTIEDPTWSEKKLYDWWESKGIPVYLLTCFGFTQEKCDKCGIVNITILLTSPVLVRRYKSNESLYFENSEEYRIWEADLRRQCEGIGFREKYDNIAL